MHVLEYTFGCDVQLKCHYFFKLGNSNRIKKKMHQKGFEIIIIIARNRKPFKTIYFEMNIFAKTRKESTELENA